MSRILLCQAPNSRVTDLGSALTQKEHQVKVWSDIDVLHESGVASEFDNVDLAIIDVTCGLDGTAYCLSLSQACPDLPIILLIAQDALIDAQCKKLTGGNILQLPFTSRKVTNRVKKVLNCRSGSVIRVGELTLNLETRCVERRDISYRLTPRQADLLEVFMRHAGRTLTRKFLMETVWDTHYMGDTRTLDVHVRWLRERIELEPSSPRYLRTVRGIGYRFAVPEEDEL